MSSNQEKFTTTEFTEGVGQPAQHPGVVPNQPPVVSQLETPSLPTISLSPPFPPRSRQFSPYLPSHSSSPLPQSLTISQPHAGLPPFSPLVPLSSQSVPLLQEDPFVTPGSSPGLTHL